ncbi:MAG: hypothetical protein U0519_00425 [Candidatus Gracilibacteria bacterium]
MCLTGALRGDILSRIPGACQLGIGRVVDEAEHPDRRDPEESTVPPLDAETSGNPVVVPGDVVGDVLSGGSRQPGELLYLSVDAARCSLPTTSRKIDTTTLIITILNHLGVHQVCTMLPHSPNLKGTFVKDHEWA